MICILLNVTFEMKALSIQKRFEGDDCEILVIAKNSWEDGYIANVEIKNTGDDAIPNEKFEYNVFPIELKMQIKKHPRCFRFNIRKEVLSDK